jgi:hypothetical protein
MSKDRVDFEPPLETEPETWDEPEFLDELDAMSAGVIEDSAALERLLAVAGGKFPICARDLRAMAQVLVELVEKG